jgi:hypothetical protein
VACGVAVTVVVVSPEEELDVLAAELAVAAAGELVGLVEVVLVAAVGMIAAVWWVLCWASITLRPTTPATLTVAMVALAVAIRRMPSARVVIATSYAVTRYQHVGWIRQPVHSDLEATA